jgi:phage terminase large subunit-like protein
MIVSEPRIRTVYKPGDNVGLFFGPEDDQSTADQVAQLSEEERERILEGVDMDALEYDHSFWLRPSQLALCDSKAAMTVALAGRGWGKSHTLSITLHNYAMTHPGSRLLLVGRTTSDVRDVMILGNSGIMNVVNPAERPKYNPATRRLTWANGSMALCYSAERPDSLRGIQAHASFCDEVAAYRSNPGTGLANAFDQVRLLTRLQYIEIRENPDGTKTEIKHHPQIFVATTPKRVPMILNLVKQAEEEGPESVLIVRGPTRANKALSDEYKDQIESMYAGTALGKQELDGELLTDVEGALLTPDIIDGTRIDGQAAEDFEWGGLPYRVVGVDPSVSSAPSDECGIVVVGATGEKKLYKRNAYVLEDASVLGPPQEWAKIVCKMARKYRAVVVAEKNQGGEMVRLVIQNEDPHVPVVLVHAAVAKEQRAEPVGTAYERGAVQHVGWFPELEAQLTGWAPGMGMASPDRMDAAVHAVTALTIHPPKELVGRVGAIGNSDRTLVGVKDHNPSGHQSADVQKIKDDEQSETPILTVDGKPTQLIIGQVRRRRNLAIGQRDIARGGRSSYTAPNRFL